LLGFLQHELLLCLLFTTLKREQRIRRSIYT
jgi:hypothetical protein